MKRIGILGIEKLIEVKRRGGLVVLLPKIDVFLDSRKDSGMSESQIKERVHEVINDALKHEIASIESLASEIVKGLQNLTKRVEVKMEADYVVYRETPVTGQKTQSTYKILARALRENGSVKKMVGAEVMGIASCPCAQEGLVEYAREQLHDVKEDVDKILSTVPVGSHNQRNVATLYIEVPEEYEIEVEGVIELLENCMSAKVYDVLKRKDEVHVVLESCRNPNFVEDVVRKILIEVVRKYEALPDESMVFAKSESFETIHQHNAIAESTSTLEGLRSEVNS